MNHTHKDKSHCNTKTKLDKEIHRVSPSNDQLHHKFLYQKIRSVITKTQCFAKVERIVVGLSGGIDSAVLLHMLMEFQKKENGPKVFALHLHHGQRGEEADRDAFAAHAIASHYDCPFGAIKLQAEQGMSEDDLRTLRHQAFQDFAKQNNCAQIVLAHHMDDQVETFLFRLIRGADLKGLTGIKKVSGNIVRPMLECSRSEIEKEAEGCGLTFVEDSSNFCTGPSRNFLRNIVLPALKAKLDPQVSQHIFDLSQSLAEVESLISLQVNEMIDQCKMSDHEYSVKKLREVPSALRKRMIHAMYTYINKDKGSLSRDQIEMIDSWMESTQSPKYLLLPCDIRVDKNAGVLMFSLVR